MQSLLKVTNHASKYLEAKAVAASKENSRSMISVGFYLRKAIKEGMLKEAPGGVRWPEASSWTKYKILSKSYKSYTRAKEKGKKRRRVKKISIGKTTTPALKKLAGAARYKKTVKRSNGGAVARTEVKVGFVSRSAAKWALYHATGPHTISVTEKMRRMVYAAGGILGADRITIPRRRHVEDVYRVNQHRIPGFVDERVGAVISGKDPKTVKARFK